MAKTFIYEPILSSVCRNQIWYVNIRKALRPEVKRSVDNHFRRISESQSFDELLSRSNERPVVIFKHSISCPISAAAYQEMSRIQDVSLVEVQTARQLSNEIERRTGVSHESPQVLVLRNGKVVWEATHWDVKEAQVAKALRENA